MSDTKWTPGPWEVRHWDGDEWPDKRTSVAERNGPGEAIFINARYARNIEANAHLIAAAPDMFAALEKMVEWHCVRGNTDEDPILDYERQPHEVRQAMDALSKARGES